MTIWKISEKEKLFMWIAFAFGSALFAGITAILAKCGIRKTDSNVATAIRTVVVLLFSWLMVFLTGSQSRIGEIGGRAWLFLILSGLATGASWLCYFKALQLGDINKVVPIDKSSVILTILLAFLFLREEISLAKAVGVVLIGIGTFLMIEKRKTDPSKQAKGNRWFLYAVSSAVFASLTSILGKVGISGVESNLGTAIRTAVVLFMAWLMVFVTGKQDAVKKIPKREFGFICLSGLLALLLQGTAGRPGQRGCSHRQAQHRRDDCFFLAGISRAFIEESWFGTGFDRSRDICDADPIVRHVFTYNYQFGKCCGCGAAFLGNICRLQCVLWLPLP